jgi:hypothetical protein
MCFSHFRRDAIPARDKKREDGPVSARLRSRLRFRPFRPFFFFVFHPFNSNLLSVLLVELGRSAMLLKRKSFKISLVVPYCIAVGSVFFSDFL